MIVCLSKRGGLTLIETLVVIAILGLLMALLAAGVQSVRCASQRLSCLNNMRQIGLALHQYHGVQGKLPPGISHPALLPGVISTYGPDTDPYPLLNWQARLLPLIEQDALWKQ